jgi:antitoxin YefM
VVDLGGPSQLTVLIRTFPVDGDCVEPRRHEGVTDALPDPKWAVASRSWLSPSGLPKISARGTIVTMTTDSLRNVKDRFSEFVDRVDREHERIVVTRNGRPAAVLISPDDLDSLEETLELLGDHDAIKELVEAEAAVSADDVVRGVDAVRALRPSTRP